MAENWNTARNQLTLEVEGLPARSYDLSIFNEKAILSVEGGTITKVSESPETLSVTLPGDDETQFVGGTVVVRLGAGHGET